MEEATDIELATLCKSKQQIKNLYAEYNEAYLKDKFPHIFNVMGDFVKPIRGYTVEVRTLREGQQDLVERYVDRPSETKQRLREVYSGWCFNESCRNVTCRKIEKINENIYVLFKATKENNYYELLLNV